MIPKSRGKVSGKWGRPWERENHQHSKRKGKRKPPQDASGSRWVWRTSGKLSGTHLRVVPAENQDTGVAIPPAATAIGWGRLVPRPSPGHSQEEASVQRNQETPVGLLQRQAPAVGGSVHYSVSQTCLTLPGAHERRVLAERSLGRHLSQSPLNCAIVFPERVKRRCLREWHEEKKGVF